MVLEVGANRGLVVHNFETVFPQVIGRSDAGQHQKLGSTQGTSRQDDRAPSSDTPHGSSRVDAQYGGRATSFDDDRRCQGPGADDEVRTAEGW
jgi:hypothetical protein